jgi:hypothetical protein
MSKQKRKRMINSNGVTYAAILKCALLSSSIAQLSFDPPIAISSEFLLNGLSGYLHIYSIHVGHLDVCMHIKFE